MTMTIAKIIEELKAENPKPMAQTNGEKYEMTGDELKEYYEDTAKLILSQRQKEADAIAQAAKKAEILDRLGLTAEEAAILLK
jgi:hypothetical protein